MADEYQYETNSDVTQYGEQEVNDYTDKATVEEVTNRTVLIDNDYNGVTINDIDGITIVSSKNKVTFNASKGIEISKLSDGKVIFSVDATTGDGVFSGNILASSFDITAYNIGGGSTVDINLNYLGLQTVETNGVNQWRNFVQQGFINNQKFTSGVLKYDLTMDASSISYNDFTGGVVTGLDIVFSPSSGLVFNVNGINSLNIDDMYVHLNKTMHGHGQTIAGLGTLTFLTDSGILEMNNGVINGVKRITISSPNTHIKLQESNVDTWHIESVSGQLKIVETSVSARILINAGTTSTQMEIIGNGSMLRLNGSVNPFIEYHIGATRQGWMGYGTAGNTLMTMRNEQGDISITPKITTNKINLNGDVYIPNGVGLTIGTANSANTANQLIIYNTGDGLVLQSSNNLDAYNAGNVQWKTSGGTSIGRLHMGGSSYATTTMQFEVTDETGSGTLDQIFELNAAGANWAKVNGDMLPASTNVRNVGSATFRWLNIYAQTTTIQTSDEREKQQISVVPDEWLDAWAELDYVRFKYNDSVNYKGNNARWHVGLIAQHIEKVFAKRGLNALQIGILCYDEWTDNDGISHNLYGIRADECQFLEMALMRRELNKLKGIV